MNIPAYKKKNTKITVAIYTLGCKLNQSETDSLISEMKNRGFEIISFDALKKGKFCDFIIINTCTVTEKADRKTRYSIYTALRLANIISKDEIIDNTTQISKHSLQKPLHNKKQSVVIVTGCFVKNDSRELSRLPIHYVVDNSRKKHIPDIIDAHHKGETPNIETLPSDFFIETTPSNAFRTRSNLKIQDGCDNFCTFCIIPTVRGSAKSKKLQKIIDDVKLLTSNGTKEIVLTGVNMSRYKSSNYTFSDVLQHLLAIDGDFRIRISSLEPDSLDKTFFKLLNHPKICPHLHLCLQSGSNKILLMMRRTYSKESFLEYVSHIKQINPSFNFTTDVIVGFPNETEKDFEETLKMIKEVGFSHVHVFPYSHRWNTRSSGMKEIDQKIKKGRIKALLELSTAQSIAYRNSFIHKTQRVLIEKVIPHYSASKQKKYIALGLSEYYIPIRLAIKEQGDYKNTFLQATPYKGEIINDEYVLLAKSSHNEEHI